MRSTIWAIAKPVLAAGAIIALVALGFGRADTMKMSTSAVQQWGWGTGAGITLIPEFLKNLQEGRADAAKSTAQPGSGPSSAPTSGATPKTGN